MGDNLNTSILAPQPGSLFAATVSVRGVQRMAAEADVRQFVETRRFFWLDLVGSDQAVRAAYLRELGLKEADYVWAQRFGQTGRMTIGEETLCTVTWLSEASGDLTEVHLLASGRYILTVWNGEANALDDIRAQFAERVEELEKSPFQAAAVVLQLLLGTLDQATSQLDVRLQEIKERLSQNQTIIDSRMLTDNLQRLQSAWSAFDRYSAAVRSAIVGIGALPGIDQQGAAELNNYADQVDDIVHRLRERYQWEAGIVQNYTAALAQRQSEQINRLTIVSIIFLPITFLTGFFGMNFDWLSNTLGSPMAFFFLGMLLPIGIVLVTFLWFKRRGLM
jgi:Mg2+ and Co2+ transporter CorA